jgi:transposase-like protein
MSRSQRDVAKELFWRDVLRQHVASGLSVREFCRREGIAEANFYAWRRTLAERDQQPAARDGQLGARAAEGRPQPAFIPAIVPVLTSTAAPTVISTVVTTEPRPDETITAVIALELRGGRTLRLPLATPPAWLAELVLALEAGASR